MRLYLPSPEGYSIPLSFVEEDLLHTPVFQNCVTCFAGKNFHTQPEDPDKESIFTINDEEGDDRNLLIELSKVFFLEICIFKAAILEGFMVLWPTFR